MRLVKRAQNKQEAGRWRDRTKRVAIFGKFGYFVCTVYAIFLCRRNLEKLYVKYCYYPGRVVRE